MSSDQEYLGGRTDSQSFQQELVIMRKKQGSGRIYSSFDSEKLVGRDKKETLDAVFNEIRFGWYQIRIYLAMGFFGMTDGAEVLVISLLLPILEK